MANIGSTGNVAYDLAGILDNKYRRGTYANIGGNNYLIQCPQEINENTKIYIAGRGSDSIGDVYSTFDAARNANVIVIAPTGEKGFEALNGVIDSLSSAVGISEPHVTFSGHSAYGNAALKAAANYARTHNAPTSVVLNDPSTYNHWSDKGIDYKALDGSLIVTCAPKGGGCTSDYMSRLQKAAQNGASVLIVRYSNGDHGDSDEISAALGTYNLSNLKLVSKGQYTNIGNMEITTGYTFQWIDENGKVHNFESVDEAQAYMNESMIKINKNLYERCDNLSDFSYLYQGSGDTLASNLSYVNNSMNEIRGQITEHQDINYTKESDNEAGIVGALYNVTNYYGSVTNLLYGNLSAETEAVYGIADAIYKMDGFSSLMAESTLSDGMSSMYDSSNPAVAEQLEKLKAATSGLYDTAKNAVLAGGRYDELTSVLGERKEAGNVGKVSISSLESAINSIVPALGDEVEKAKSLKSGVSEFMTGIGASNTLQGGVWEDVKINMANYENLLDANVKAATFIQDSVLTAMGMVTDYINSAGDKIAAVGALENYGNLATSVEELDDSKLPELASALSEMQAKIDETDAKVVQMEASRHMVEDGYYDHETGQFVKTGEHQEPSEAEIQVYRDLLAKYTSIKSTLDSYREVLEGLAPVVQAAQEVIQNAVDQVKGMYENPVQDTDGNLTFNADFNLDLSPYSDYIDTAKDYKSLVNDYYSSMKEPEVVNPQVDNSSDTTVGNSNPDYPTNTNPNTGNDKPYGNNNSNANSNINDNSNGTQSSTPNTQKSEIPTVPKTDPIKEKTTEATTEPFVAPWNEEGNELPWADGDDDIIVIPNEPDGPVNLPYGPYFDENAKPKIVNLDAELANDMESNIETPIIQEEVKVPNEYTEVAIEQPNIINISSNSTPISNQPQPQKNSLKTMGIAASVGVALGAAALGAHTIMKDKEEDEEDYGYNK